MFLIPNIVSNANKVINGISSASGISPGLAFGNSSVNGTGAVNSAQSVNGLGSSSSGSSESYFTNNSFMEYLQGLLASTGQEAVENRLFNASEAEKARKFSSEEAEKNRKWQEELSNTSYQRVVKDLQAAGLNPILAFQQGGASTPSGSAAQSSAASINNISGDTLSTVLNSFANLISSASDIMQYFIPSLKSVTSFIKK